MIQANGRGGATQQRVRDAVTQVGGYWRPLAGVARLLEELGELAESLAKPVPVADEFASELADLWIITTALADQFLGEAVEPRSHSRQTPATGDPIGELAVAAGQIARIVNYYDGPKTPRSVDGWPSLNDAVAEFQRVLAAIAQAHDVDLGLAVEEKLDAIPARDARRFRHREQDPSTAPSLERFRPIQTNVLAAQPAHARLWGAPVWSASCFASNVQAIVPSLTSFSRAAIRERLHAFVIAGPSFGSIESTSEWFERLLNELLLRDPKREDVGRDPERDDVGRDPVSAAGRRFTFEGLPMFVEAFSPLHMRGHPRHSPTDTFVVLWPDEQRGAQSAS
jgi:NTP pyrophosphatase (non-canonical NTP hydrolase)